MLHSDNFQETTITLNDHEYRMEYDVQQATVNSIAGFGNIYINEDEPMEFTFFTIDGRIAGYTPMNLKKEVIADIVEAAIGQRLEVDDQ